VIEEPYGSLQVIEEPYGSWQVIEETYSSVVNSFFVFCPVR
jgi:hypothetical protein